MEPKETYFHDYLAIAFVGVLFGYVALGGAAGAGDWGRFIGALIVADLFITLPGGFVVGYLLLRLSRASPRPEMSGLSMGFFTGFVYLVITLFLTIVQAILNTANAGNIFVAWIISVVFAFLFYMLGGFLAGSLERRPYAMPSIFDLSKISTAPPPPPPPGTTQTCPTCGKPLRFIEQYQRWYCDNEKKYV
jgi:hypothetical protein